MHYKQGYIAWTASTVRLLVDAEPVRTGSSTVIRR